MNKIVKVSMPVNATSDDAFLFKPYLSYKLLTPKIKYVRTAFVTNMGVVCGSKGLIKECCHYEWPGQTYLLSKDVLFIYSAAQKNPEKCLIFDDDETYLLIHHPWYANYYHWLIDSIHRLWAIKDKANEMILFLPPESRLSSFAIDSLKPFNFKKIIHIPNGKSALVRRLCIPTQKPHMDGYNPAALIEIGKMYRSYISSKRINVIAGERIYVSRKNSKTRKIVNEDEVIKTMLKYNFTIICNEDYTFFEQVSIFSQAKYLVGIHGAGLTNMLFMQPGSTVFELIKRKTNPIRHFNLLFWYIADALRHKYYYQICEPINIDELFHTADVMVDIELLTKNLDSIFLNDSYNTIENNSNIAAAYSSKQSIYNIY
jgi:capsular polysaccharide biosynthesis protein